MSAFSIHKTYTIYSLVKIYILLILFALFPVKILAQSYNFRNYNLADGLPQSFVYSVIQDTHGYLWIGTGNGLSRFNGFKFENFTTHDSLADNFISCSIGDGEDLWFGHMNGKISLYNGKIFQSINVPQNTSQITHFEKSTDGLIWASTYADGLLILNKKSGEVKQYLFKDQILIKSFSFLNNRELLVGTNTGLLYCRLGDATEIKIVKTIVEIPESKITAIRKIKKNAGFFIATEDDGIFQLHFEKGAFHTSKIIADSVMEITGIQSLFEDSQFNLWLSTFGNGLIKLNYSGKGIYSKVNYFNKEKEFITDNIKTVFQDCEGNIWSGNYGEGLTQITPKTFSTYKFDNIYGNNISSLYFNKEFKWIGTESGLIKIDQLNGKILKFYSNANGLSEGPITSIYSSDGKTLWIGTDKNGMFRMEIQSEKFRKYVFGDEELENSINMITGKGEQVWIGTKKGLHNINTATNVRKSYSINKGGLPHNNVNCIYIDSKNKVWVTTRSNTLSYIVEGKVIKVLLNAIDGNFTLGPVAEDKNSRIWVGSNGKGAFMIGDDSIANFTTKEGLISNYCYSLVCDDNKNLWIGHKGGLSKIKTSDFSIKPIPNFGNKSGNYQFNPNTVFNEPEKIWFGTDKGLLSYDPSMEYPLMSSPVLGITSIRINDEEIDFTNVINLAPGNYKLKIDFLGISLKDPSLVTYQYKLDGYDQWSELTKKMSVIYHHLSEGKYTFILKASSGDGIVSEKPLTITIIIKKPIWKKWWFFPAAFLLVIILISAFIKKQEKRFIAEKELLEEKVRERTQEIQYQKDKIENQRDSIDVKNAEITSSITYASHIQNAILPPLELVNKLLPDNFILSKPKDIVSGDFYWIAEKNEKIIITIADCTGHGVPGAFMSLLGITILNEIVNIQGITKSDAIISKLRESITRALQQNRKNIATSDGMDIAICVLDQKQQKIQYSGGMHDFIFIRNGKLGIIKSDRFSVCVENGHNRSFSMKEIDIKKGDAIYLFSDGYKDQFGGDHDKKFLIRRLYKTLLEIHEMPMQEQRHILEACHNEWKGNNIQTDDIIVMGIRI